MNHWFSSYIVHENRNMLSLTMVETEIDRNLAKRAVLPDLFDPGLNQSFGESKGCARPSQVRRDTSPDYAPWWM